MWQSLKQIISDSSGKISFLRVSSAITLLTILGVFIEKNIVNHGLIDIGPNMLLVILFVISGKVVSGMFENNKDVKIKELTKNPDPNSQDT